MPKKIDPAVKERVVRRVLEVEAGEALRVVVDDGMSRVDAFAAVGLSATVGRWLLGLAEDAARRSTSGPSTETDPPAITAGARPHRGDATAGRRTRGER